MSNLPYQIKRSRRKTLAIQIRHPNVMVHAPARLPLHVIHDFVSRKEPWIRKKLSEQADKLSERYEIADDGLIPFKGELKKICCLDSDKNHVDLINQHIVIGRKADSCLSHQQLFEQWLIGQAKETLTARAFELADQLGVQYKLKAVRFRKTRSKWGHCSSDGVLQFNWLILMAPEFVFDYIVAHEVCHLLQFDHSKLFWAQVEALYGDYRPARQWLKTHGHTLCLK